MSISTLAYIPGRHGHHRRHAGNSRARRRAGAVRPRQRLVAPSPRNNYVAGVLRQAGVGTLLIDLLTPEEDRDYARRFDIALLTQRLLDATRWLQVRASHPRTAARLFRRQHRRGGGTAGRGDAG